MQIYKKNNIRELVMFISGIVSLSSIRAFHNSKTCITHSRLGGKRKILASALQPKQPLNQPFRSHGLLAQFSGKEQSSNTKSNSTLYMSTATAAFSVGGAAFVGSDMAACDELNIFSEEVLKYDTYNGVTLKLDSLVAKGERIDVSTFAVTLENSLNHWKKEGKRGIWLHIPTSCSDVVPICAELGFEFQYATSGLLVMTNWLPEECESRLPFGPTHQVGIGAVILHPTTNKMLVVKEKSGPAAARNLWKMPTGLTDPGEDVVDAAIRESKEETGLDVEFDRIICMRQAHGGIFNHSDMYFVCLLRLPPKYLEGLKNGVDIPLKPQEEEIAEISWMTTEEYANQDAWQGSPAYEHLNGAMLRVAEAVSSDKRSSESTGQSDHGLVAMNLPVGWRPGSQTIYLSKM